MISQFDGEKSGRNNVYFHVSLILISVSMILINDANFMTSQLTSEEKVNISDFFHLLFTNKIPNHVSGYDVLTLN